MPVFIIYFVALEILKKENNWFLHANRNQVFLIFQISRELQRSFEIANLLFFSKKCLIDFAIIGFYLYY